MKKRIFLLSDAGGMSAMVEETFSSEDFLQCLLADHPALLAGDQMDEQRPRQWLLVSREAGVPDREDGANRWSLDHLFLDQDGVPTLVEVKRSSDTRIRREVIGQMLDYAANGLAYWPVEKLRALFEADCEVRGCDPAVRLQQFLADEALDVDSFWLKVKDNLQAGRIRMVFVADEIPPELRRVVEFLNAQMDPAEVLAVAVRQYVGEGLRTLVPQLVGRTAKAESRKAAGARPKRRWDEDSFFTSLAEAGVDALEGARRLYQWARQHMPRITWGAGTRYGSCIPVRDVGGVAHYPFALWTNGTLEVQFHYAARRPPFDDEGRRREFLERLNQVPGLEIPPDAYNRMPSFPVAVLAREESWAAFEGVLSWFLTQIGAEPEQITSSSEGGTD